MSRTLTTDRRELLFDPLLAACPSYQAVLAPAARHLSKGLQLVAESR